MATNCSFIKATEARNLARNNTLIWTEICEVQAAILAAIDANAYSTIVNDGTPFTSTQSILSVTVTNGGTGYNLVSATAVINDGGTAGNNSADIAPIVTGTTITGFTVIDPGTGYTPVNATATPSAPSDLKDGQDETNYTTRFNGGSNYAVGDTITLSENSVITVAPGGINITGYVLTSGLDETHYVGGGANGTLDSGGAGYAVLDTITLTDGTFVTVDAAPAGIITEFTITTSSTSPRSIGLQRTQVGSSGSGSGFAITPGTNNETGVGVVTLFDVASAAVDAFFLGGQLTQASTSGIGTGFNLTPVSPNNVNPVGAGIGATFTVIQTNGAVTSVVVNTGGSGYQDENPIIINHPNGTGATAVASSIGPSNEILAVTVTTSGSGYQQAVATVTVTPPNPATIPAVEFVGTVQTVKPFNGPNNYTSGLAFDSAGPYTITRSDGTSFTASGTTYSVGKKIMVSNAEDAANNKTYTITNVTATVITVNEAIIVTNASDVLARINPTNEVTGIIITEGGTGYASLFPTATVTGAGSGATFTTNVAGGALTAVNVTAGGSGWNSATATVNPTIMTITAAPTSGGSGATATATAGTNTFSTDPGYYYDVWIGQETDAVVSDQIQYVLDYFTSLGYNIRAQTNSVTASTLQWQIIW